MPVPGFLIPLSLANKSASKYVAASGNSNESRNGGPQHPRGG
jgi:hypothetical protein